MVEMNIASLPFEKYSSTFRCYQFLPDDIDSELLKEFSTSVVRQGTVNSVLYWFNISFFDQQRYYSTLHDFSYVHQAAFHTSHPLTFEQNENAVIRFVYHHGAFLINLRNE